MDRDTRDYWVEALRSGEFPQAHCLLHRRGGYCCLGVIAKINGVLSVRGKVEGNRFTLPNAARNAWGLTLANVNRLIELNDSRGQSFDEIANWIEANL